MNLIRVKATARTNAVAGSIAGMIRENESVEVQAFGANAVNQAVKAIALANTYLQADPTPLSITCVPSMVQLEIEGQERTAIRLTIAPVAMPSPG